MKRTFIISACTLIFLSGVLTINKPEEETLIIAACPTFHYILDEIDLKGIRTESTAKSLELLENGNVDLVISGRPLKIDEADFFFEIVGSGYDFVSVNGMIINESEMSSMIFYTDMDIKDVLSDFKYLSDENLNEVDDIDDYLDKGIVITQLNEMKGENVHVFKNNGHRVRSSRRPRLYFKSHPDKEIIERIKAI